MSQFLSLLGTTAEQGSGGWMIVVIYAAFFFFMWFVLIRPQRKKQKDVNRMQSEIKIGDSVLTQGGLYGTVVDTVNDVLIVEFGLNKGIRVPVQRSAVASVTPPELTVSKEEPAAKE